MNSTSKEYWETFNLENYRLYSDGIDIATIYYIPNFVDEYTENLLLKEIYKVPTPKWTQLSHRRLQNWGGIPHKNGMIAESIPTWLQVQIDNIMKLEIFPVSKKPNHVLINEYKPGQGIMPHFDGPLFHPIISTISLGSSTVLNFYDKLVVEGEHKRILSILLESRSLLLVKDKMYCDYMHGIDEVEFDFVNQRIANMDSNKYSPKEKLARSNRISLTIRHVPKTSKLKISL